MQPPIESDPARAASWLADRSRVAMLSALAEGKALPAGELARAAAIGAAAASEHLAKLRDAGLVEVVSQGRHRYYRLVSSEVAELLERLAVLVPPPRPLTASAARVAAELRLARTCYGHLAGAIGVSVTRALFDRALLCDAAGACVVTGPGKSWLRSQGVDVEPMGKIPARLCPVDWTERRPHLAGALGKGLTDQVLGRGYAVRVRASRALRFTERGSRWLRDALGIDLEALSR
jgi:DNA-binding transcriptional ArsR family regulator